MCSVFRQRTLDCLDRGLGFDLISSNHVCQQASWRGDNPYYRNKMSCRLDVWEFKCENVEQNMAAVKIGIFTLTSSWFPSFEDEISKN